ncbi:MAG: hypothetical protein N2554_03255 [Fimbriimonadales bacterium]|nr:hypothetical protein [Fimbriimonadales bacterium]
MGARARRALFVWLAATLLAACGEPEYTIKRTLRQGEQWRYTLQLQGELKGQADTLKLDYVDTVLSVAEDGSAIVERALQATPEQLKRLQASAGPFGVLKPKTRWKLFPDGRETPLDKDAFVIGAFIYAYPDRPVRIGAQWGRIDGFGSMQVKYLCRLEGVETLDGVRCYKIATQVEPMPDSLPQMTGEMTVYVDAEHGWVRQIRGTLKMQAGELEGAFQLQLHGAPAGDKP